MLANGDNDILYEARETDVVPQKLADRRRNTITVVTYITLQIILVLLLSVTLGLVGVIGFAFLVFLLPSALVPMPVRYKITRSGILWGRRRLRLAKISKVQLNEKRSFISLMPKGRGESLRLYAREPQEIYRILTGLLGSRTSPESSSQ